MLTGRFLTGERLIQRGPKPWYRLKRYQLPIVAAIVLAAVLTDRYDTYSSPQRAHQLVSLYSSVRQDLQSCRDGVAVATAAWHKLPPTPPARSAAAAANLARTAEANCTPASDDGGIYNLGSLQVPGALNKENKLPLALYDLEAWAYPNAARALIDLESLDRNPEDTAARTALATAAYTMQRQSTAAKAIFQSASATLGANLHWQNLPQP